MTPGDEIDRTHRLLRGRLEEVGLWGYVGSFDGSTCGRLVFRAQGVESLRAELGNRPDFTGPFGGASAWRSRERRACASLHFKHFAGWPIDRVEVHLDPIGPWGRPWWKTPWRLVLHALDLGGYRDLDRLERILGSQKEGRNPLSPNGL